MRFWITCAFCSLFIQGNAQFEKLEASVRKALAVDKPYKALTLTDRALSRKGAPEVFHVLRAEAYNRIGSYREARQQLQRAPSLKQIPDYRTNLIGSFTGLGLLDSAEALVLPAIPTDASEEYLYRAGRVLFLRERWTSALGHFQAGVERSPSSPRMIRERGACHAMLGDTSKAAIDLDRAIQLAPRDAAGYNSRGYFRYMRLGQYAKAIADMDKAIKQDPNYGFAFSNRGWSYYQLGDSAKAQRDLLLAVRKNPTNAYAYRSLGIIDLAQGQQTTGCAHLRKALELGFTATYGNEVQDLVSRQCPRAAEPVQVPDTPVVPTPPPTNAPNAPAKPRSNAP
jgi:tetratricopeptide (TPR) repeat protein